MKWLSAWSTISRTFHFFHPSLGNHLFRFELTFWSILFLDSINFLLELLIVHHQYQLQHYCLMVYLQLFPHTQLITLGIVQLFCYLWYIFDKEGMDTFLWFVQYQIHHNQMDSKHVFYKLNTFCSYKSLKNWFHKRPFYIWVRLWRRVS